MSSRIWVVTGASSGIGLAIAERALAGGDKVIATVRSLSKFPASLKDAGAQPLVLDLTDSDESLHKAAERAIETYGHVDVLVNNAGIGGIGPLEELPLSDIRRHFQVNVFGSIAFSQPFITHFRTRRAGHVLNVSSGAAMLSPPSVSAYSASKAAVESYTEALAAELALYDVRVHIIQPGTFATNMIYEHPSYRPGGSGLDDIPVPEGLTKIYTHPSQGFNFMNVVARVTEQTGKRGDTSILAERVWEVVTDTGIAKEVGLKEKPKWIRLAMGSDCGEMSIAKVESVLENYRGLEPIWRSTDLKKAT